MELKIGVSQNLNLSHKMLQSIEILQMSAMELESYLEKFAMENPVVELEENFNSENTKDDIKRKLEWLDSSDEQNQVYFNQEYDEFNNQKEEWNIFQDQGERLEEYLFSQLLTEKLASKEFEIAEYMILSLDSKGYMKESLESISEQLQVPIEQVEKTLTMLQRLDPAGIFAVNLQNCLLIQVERLQINNPHVKIIIEQYLEELGKNKIPSISKKLGITIDETIVVCDIIRKLNPIPGNAFNDRENLKYIIPDVIVVKLKNHLEILINDYQYPKLNINNYYLQMIQKSDSSEVKNYLKQKVKQAEWVVTCLGQRNFTLMRVANKILEEQESFFFKGPGFKKPLRLIDVAEKLEIHESTVSRAIKGKYLQCNWGIYPLNYFFTGSIRKKDNEGVVTPELIKQMIKELVQGENKKKPYSDRIIAEKLQENQVVISRRTVAKYRDEMDIPDASSRKYFFI